ncbi:MmyB family transcriptional regulator [Sinosporangium siamense]|uniref:MmyB-like transcription regulator ligand binding domain-containing protein n=1 Tax=Sinosporangium siamense TaxID=1367973 RepID=A0A919RJZ9_9ACTN|nr:hypothetical protein [Sinosporangium siamense]GII94235.1 hypothetical protein Ssi02_44660 [Sinosporangium siamense]
MRSSPGDESAHAGHGTRRFHRPAVGVLELDYEVFKLPAETPLTLLAYSAAPVTPSGDRLHFLAARATSSAQVRHATE